MFVDNMAGEMVGSHQHVALWAFLFSDKFLMNGLEVTFAVPSKLKLLGTYVTAPGSLAHDALSVAVVCRKRIIIVRLKLL
jgi:hypothetical protein